jgi:TP901 family phage tail tape measure protein
MADVRKVVSGLDTPAGLKEIRAEIIGLSKEMPIAAEGFAAIYAAGGRSGIARNELKAFVLTSPY